MALRPANKTGIHRKGRNGRKGKQKKNLCIFQTFVCAFPLRPLRPLRWMPGFVFGFPALLCASLRLCGEGLVTRGTLISSLILLSFIGIRDSTGQTMRTRLLFIFLLSSITAFGWQPGPSTMAQSADNIVANYRRVIVLMEDDPSLDAAKKERAVILARMLFEQNEENLEGLRAEPVNGSTPAVQKRIVDDIAALARINALYEKELGQVFDRIRVRGMSVRREAWDKYLADIKTKYQRDGIFKEYEALLPVEETRGGGTNKKKRNPNVLDGTELPARTLLLTFDDGPHPRYTDEILAVLKKYNLQGVFFQVGHNIGTVGADGKVTLGKGAAASTRILEAGSSLGNHSFNHPLLPKMDAAGYTKEIGDTDKLLKVVLKGDPVLFRPPYGAENDGILNLVVSNNMKSMIWNIDSMDWADPVAASVAQRVLKEIDKQGRGVILFHDIHRRALDALPGLIEAFQKQGYRFASWNGTGFAVSDARGVETVALPKTPDTSAPYRESWAAVIGIDDYQKWPRLRYAA